jgi:alpha-methylacyl-CoA racemase
VLELNEVGEHPHNQERELLISIDGATQPTPAPRLSRTPGMAMKAGSPRGSSTRKILTELSYSTEEINNFFEKDIVE